MSDAPVLHPDIAALAEFFPEFDLANTDLPELRATSAAMFAKAAPPHDAVERVDHVISTDPHLTVRVYRPKQPSASPVPGLYSIHGGGYVVGSVAMNDDMLDGFCAEFGCVCVAIEYRLAPEAPYPDPLEDCYRGLQWTFEHAAELGIDTERIGIEGGSAGGGLAAGLALLARDRGEMDVAFQLLQCPMLDDRQLTPSSCADGLVIWSRESNTFGWRSYLGDLYGRDDVPAYAAPARAAELRGLPPTFVITGGADGFCDENILYALRLGQAGVQTDLLVIAGAPHGAPLFGDTEPARRWTAATKEWLRPRLTPVPH